MNVTIDLLEFRARIRRATEQFKADARAIVTGATHRGADESALDANIERAVQSFERTLHE